MRRVKKLSAVEILETAASLVGGDRAETHGDMRAVHRDAARMWSLYIGRPIDARDVAVMMALLKIVRQKHGRFNLDDYIDGAGYLAIAGALAEPDEC